MQEKTTHQQNVEEFMRKAGQDVPTTPTVPSPEVRLLRARLIMEECLETVEALGVDLSCDGDPSVPLLFGDMDFHDNGKVDLVEIVDGCCDIAVVTTGTLSACGIPDKRFRQVIDESNLAKFEGDAHEDPETGKWIKPTGWKAPDLLQMIQTLTLLQSEPTCCGRACCEEAEA